jgi:predicted ABC-type ATPase
VARRVREGGHAIPASTVVRRYWAGLSNLRTLYLPLADVAAIYNNSDEGRVLVAERTPENAFVVHDKGQWSIIERAAP